MKRFLLFLIVVSIWGCDSKPTISHYDIEKNTLDSICNIYNADPLQNLASELIVADIDTWKKQRSSKLKNHVFKIDFFSSIIQSGDSLFLVNKDLYLVSKIYLPNNFKKIEDGDYVIFSIDKWNTTINKNDIDFFITGSIVDVIN